MTGPGVDPAETKIWPIDEMPEVLAPVKVSGRTVVQCHGVFDLLHIGHIKHLERAKTFGDVLVVTVTPDRFVNKGPHRPAFHETLRAQALAALEVVDFVTINEWPTAVEAITTIAPDVYVKGVEYQVEVDRTGGIKLETDAVEAAGGRVEFTEEITFASTSLINQYMPAFPPQVSQYLSAFAANNGVGAVLDHLERIQGQKVLVVGESIIDEYRYARAIGKSSKEPMLALKQLSTERFAGGILAVARHVASFADQVGVISFLGDRDSHEEFIRASLESNIEPMFLYQKDSPTVVKQRFVEEYFFTKLIEIYDMNDTFAKADDDALCNLLSERIAEFDVVIVVDFGHGMLSERAIDIVTANARFLALNTQSNAGNHGYHTISRYTRADYITLAENEVRLDARDRQCDLEELVIDLSKRLSCPKIAVTRGKSGCLCYDAAVGFVAAPALAVHVEDRVGAGDAFLAVTAPCVAQGASMEVVGFVGNAVGAQAVATVGNRTPVERVSLFRQIESLLK